MITMIKRIKKLFNIILSIKYLKLFLFYNVVPTFEYKYLLKQLKDCNTVIDIGANKGQFSLIANDIFIEPKIIAFEPLKTAAKKYNKLFHKNKNVTLYNNAVGKREKKVNINVSKREDSSSILNIGKKQSLIFPGTEISHKEKITISPLNKFIVSDDLISPVFVKIDVQGYELEVLKGCNNFFEYFDYIFVECSFIELYEGQALAHEVIEYLKKHSFKFEGIYNIFYDKYGIAVQGDLLFRMRKK